MKRAITIAVLVVVALAYIAGYWPQHQRLTDAQAQLQETQNRLAVAEGRIRLGEVLGQLFRLSDAVAAKNYGEAATLSSSFFDSVRVEASRADKPDVMATLQAILNTRDQVTTAIAGMDLSLSTVLKEQERALRLALGYPVTGPA
ncbi:MAG: hypothetical protein A3H97_15000 [Acidobacteria bacterium RIFCSPLOWO2_02_FULL_65_29]|nr:MAG: hypothetical protein A3H97_15000 [Acidobacteria bacterium RIFCSPLOWO2_02_FULL_65_29]